MVKTILAFANDAGGELYIGIKDNPREVVGLNEDDLPTLEEKIASLVHDLCEPIILPEISFLQHEGKHIIRTQVFKGSAPPYYLKNKSILEGTFIRVGIPNCSHTGSHKERHSPRLFSNREGHQNSHFR